MQQSETQEIQKAAAPWRRCAWGLAGMLILGALALAAVNVWADPYALFRSIEAHHRPALQRNQRIVKAERIADLRPQVLLLGSSRMENGMDARNPLLVSQGQVYNAGLTDASLYEVRRMAEHTAALADAQLWILGLDFFQFMVGTQPRPGWREDRLAVSPRSWPQPFHRIPDRGIALWSWSGLQTSLDPALAPWSQGQWLQGWQALQDRSAPRAEDILWWESGFGTGMNAYVDRLGMRSSFVHKELGEMLTRYPSYLVSENIRQQRFEAAFLELDRICQLAESQGVTLWIYISPVHARLLPLLESVGLDVWWTEWRRRVATLVEDYDEDQCVAWDFSGYNSITTEAVPRDEQARMRYYWEASHFRPAVGDAMIQRMSGQTDILYQDFGHRLRSAEMDAYLAREQRQAALWRESLDARETALIIRFLQEHYAQPAMLEAALTHPSEVLVPWLDDRLAAEQSEASP